MVAAIRGEDPALSLGEVAAARLVAVVGALAGLSVVAAATALDPIDPPAASGEGAALEARAQGGLDLGGQAEQVAVEAEQVRPALDPHPGPHPLLVHEVAQGADPALVVFGLDLAGSKHLDLALAAGLEQVAQHARQDDAADLLPALAHGPPPGAEPGAQHRDHRLGVSEVDLSHSLAQLLVHEEIVATRAWVSPRSLGYALAMDHERRHADRERQLDPGDLEARFADWNARLRSGEVVAEDFALAAHLGDYWAGRFLQEQGLREGWQGQVSDDDLARLGKLPGVETLFLSQHVVSDAGLAHLRELATLRRLQLVGRPITDAGLAHLEGMSALVELGLRATQVRGPGLRHLEGLSALESLSLGCLPLEDEHLAHLRSGALRALSLERCQRIGDAGVANLPELPELERLSLADTKVTGACLKAARGCAKLRRLSLERTRVRDEHLAHLAGLGALRDLHLNGTQVTSEGSIHLSRLRLETLYLNDCAGADGSSLLVLPSERLMALGLARTDTTDVCLHFVGGFTSLYVLDLSATRISDAGLAPLSALVGLGHLDLSGNAVGAVGLASLGELPELSDLSLAETQVDDRALAEIAERFPKLRNLDLRETAVTDEGLAQLSGLESLSSVDARGSAATPASDVRLAARVLADG